MGFDTSLRDQAVRRERARREEVRQRVVANALAALDELAPAWGVSRAYIFGSASRPGTFSLESDVDIAVAGTVENTVILAARLSRRIGREVHVLELDGSPAAARARREGIEWTPRS